jgi:hypothetical protein
MIAEMLIKILAIAFLTERIIFTVNTSETVSLNRLFATVLTVDAFMRNGLAFLLLNKFKLRKHSLRTLLGFLEWLIHI